MQIFANPHDKAREAKPEMCLFFLKKRNVQVDCMLENMVNYATKRHYVFAQKWGGSRPCILLTYHLHKFLRKGYRLWLMSISGENQLGVLQETGSLEPLEEARVMNPALDSEQGGKIQHIACFNVPKQMNLFSKKLKWMNNFCIQT